MSKNMPKLHLVLYQKFAVSLFFTFVFILTRNGGKSFKLRDLAEANFNETLRENLFVLVVYYASGCGPCEKFLLDFEYAGGQAIENRPPILFAKVDCAMSQAGSLCLDITDIPAMKFYKYGRYADNFEFKERKYMAQFAGKFVKPDVEEILSKRHFVEYLASTTYAVIGMFPKPSRLKEAYLNVTNLMYGRFDFAQTSEKEILDYQKVGRGIVVYKPDYMRNEYEEDFSIYNGEPDLDKIKAFLLRNFHGLVGFRRPDNKHEFRVPLLTVFYDFNFNTNYAKSKAIRKTLLSVANEYKNRFNFAMSTATHWDGLLRKFGVNLDDNLDRPVTTAVDVNERKYLMEGEYSEDNLRDFLRKFLEKSLKPYVRSGPIPSKNDGSLLELVASNLEEVLFSDEEDAFLYIYDPNCSVCQVMTKELQKLGEELKDEDILLCQIDGVVNDLPRLVKAVSYPTVYYLQKDRKHNPIQYFGTPRFDDLLTFVTRHSSEDLKKFDRSGNRIRKEKVEL